MNRGLPVFSEAHFPFSQKEVSVSQACVRGQNSHPRCRCTDVNGPAPIDDRPRGPEPVNGVFVVLPLWPLEAAWYTACIPASLASLTSALSGSNRWTAVPSRATGHTPALSGQSQGGQDQLSPHLQKHLCQYGFRATRLHVGKLWPGQNSEALVQLLGGT